MRVLLVGPDFEENLSIRGLAAALHDAGFECESSRCRRAIGVQCHSHLIWK
jgi:hypothetical protein